jgi:hypothetical protein
MGEAFLPFAGNGFGGGTVNAGGAIVGGDGLSEAGYRSHHVANPSVGRSVAMAG